MEPYLEPDNALPYRSLEEEFRLEETTRYLLARRHNIRFEELLTLAKKVGFQFRHEGTSHYIGKHPTYTLGPLYYDQVNFQNKNGKAKPKQVKDFVDFVRDAQPKGDRNA